MRSARVSNPAYRRPPNGAPVCQRTLYLKSCLHPRHALYPFYRTTSFSRRFARLRVAGRWMFSRFQRTRDHPLTRCLQAISDTKVDRWILPDDEPGHIFFKAPAGAVFIVKKINPGRPGRTEVIFFKNILRNPRSGL